MIIQRQGGRGKYFLQIENKVRIENLILEP